MQFRCATATLLCAATLFAARPSFGNRMVFEIWPDASPDHAVFCAVALADGWISLVKVKGPGMPGPDPLRWRASADEVDAMSNGLQVFVAGTLASVNPHGARPPPAPFVTVTWMTRLDDRLATGLYMQPGLTVPDTLAQTLASLGLSGTCGFSAKSPG